MAWDNVRSQRLRTGITASIIAIGITELVGILTSVSALRSSMVDSFKSFGANTVGIYGGRWAPKENDPNDWVFLPRIDYRQAREFKTKMGKPADSQIQSLERTMFFNGLDGIFRTGRYKTA